MQEQEQEMDSGYLRHIIAKSRARLKELESIKNCPRIAIESEKEHLRKYEAMLIALNH